MKPEMGNRGTVVFTTDQGEISPAIYLHWNGGPESVYAFCAELDQREVRADADYEAARFCQLVGEFFDSDGQGGLSLGLANGPASLDLEDLVAIRTDLSDNGVYVINRSGPTTTVRRFLNDWSGGMDSLTEMSAEAVAREVEEARCHEYQPKFREFFEGLRSRRALTSA